MFTIEPTREQFEGFASAIPDGQPIVMINLLRFRERADSSADSRLEQRTGREAYELYSQHALKFLTLVGGRPIWRGQARYCVIGPPGERWDEALLVQYPSRSAFQKMINDPGYQAGLSLRTAALEDSRLICTLAPQRIHKIAWWLYNLSLKRLR
jgi:uncharacterized protein (DUF1330 family)